MSTVLLCNYLKKKTVGNVSRNKAINKSINQSINLSINQSIFISGTFDIVEYYENTLHGLPQILEVDRESLWQQSFAYYKRACDVNRPFRIIFKGEEGIDAGGPRREYYQNLANHIASEEVGYFEGKPDALLPVMRSSTLRLGHFRIIGKMIMHSIANGGVGKLPT